MSNEKPGRTTGGAKRGSAQSSSGARSSEAGRRDSGDSMRREINYLLSLWKREDTISIFEPIFKAVDRNEDRDLKEIENIC